MMNRLIICILAFLLWWPLTAFAAENRQLHATWEHDDPQGDVAGFRIYYQGNVVCETYSGQARSLDCEVLISGYPAFFTATAYDSQGRESTASEPFLLEQPLSVNLPPHAFLEADRSTGMAPHLVNFDGSASYDQDGAIESYAWDFGDGRTGSGPSASHTYYSAGLYHVTLTVTDNRNASSQAQEIITVIAPTQPGANQPPSASVSANPLEGRAPLAVRFDALDSRDPDGELAEFLWDFGDGTTASGETITHIYTAPGTYLVSLTITDNQGAQAQSTIQVSVLENTSTAAGFAFNFQPAESPVPEGYVADSGLPFNPLTGFGWSIPPVDSPGATARNSIHAPAEIFDTFIHANPGAVWELSLPNGEYVVTVCVSDPAHPEGRQNVKAEGIQVIDNENLSPAKRWLERAVHIPVRDGKLTLTFDGAVPHAKLAWLRVDHAGNWKPSLFLPRHHATRVGKPVKFAWSSSPADPHLASASPVTYTLYYGTDPSFASSAVAKNAIPSSALGVALAGMICLGWAGLTVRRYSAVPLAALAMASGLAILSSCGGGGGDGSPGTGGIPPFNPGIIAEARVIKNLETTTFEADDLLPATTYHWKIVADDGRSRMESRVFSFTTE